MATFGQWLLGGFVISMMVAGLFALLVFVWTLSPVLVWALVNFGAFGADL